MQDTAESITLAIFRGRSRGSVQVFVQTVFGCEQTGRKAAPAVVYGCAGQRRTCPKSQFENMHPLHGHKPAKNGEILSYTKLTVPGTSRFE